MQPPKRTGGGSGGREQQLMPDGTQPATIVGIFSVGTQTTSFRGQEKKSARLLISFELTEGRDIEIEKKKEHIKYLISGDYPYSYYKDSSLKRAVESLIGRKMTEIEKEGDEEGNGFFDLETLLGSPCMIDIQNTEYESKKYNETRTDQKVKSVLALPKALTAVMTEPQREPITFDINEYGSLEKLQECEKFKGLNKFVMGKVKASLEYKELQKMAGNANTEEPEEVSSEDNN